MVVLDGIVMGPTHCAFPGCISDLQNACGGAFCSHHKFEFGSKCCVIDCPNNKIETTEACQAHASEWRKNIQQRNQSNVNGIHHILQHPGENQAWQHSPHSAIQYPHDEDPENSQRKGYFSPNWFYCIETICAPCGVVIAWTKFAKAESPTNILNFLQDIFPTEESRPDYICIDKACQVMQTSVNNGSWNTWKRPAALLWIPITTLTIVQVMNYVKHIAIQPQQMAAHQILLVERLM